MEITGTHRSAKLQAIHPALLSAAAVILISYLVFVLPYSFPPHTRLVSGSYPLGFNNRIAIFSVALSALVLASLRLHSAGSIVWSILPQPQRDTVPRNNALWHSYVVAALAYLAFTLAIYFVIARPNGYYKLDWESSHFIWRTRLMTVYGLKPYRDFLGEYGPALIYLPTWAAILLRPIGISTEASYYVLHYLLNLLGLLGLLYLVDSFSIDLRVKRLAFLLVGLAAFSEMMGLNGLLIRYILPYTCLLLVYREAMKATERNTFWRLYVIIGAASAATIAISPDVGVEWLVGLTAFAGIALRGQRALGLRILVAELIFVALSPLLLPKAYFYTLLSFSQGGNNFPILPALHILFYLSVFLLCVPRFLVTAWQGQSLSGAYAAGLAAICLATLPAALGRCDLPHVILNGFGLYTLAFAAFAQDGRRRLMIYTVAYIAIAMVEFRYVNARWYGVTRTYLRAGISQVHNDLEQLGSKLGLGSGTGSQAMKQGPQTDPYAPFAKYPSLELPYGTYGYEKALQRYLWSTKKIAPEHYMGAVGVYNQQHLDQRLQELAESRYVLIEKNFLKLYENRDLCSELRNQLKSSFLVFWVPTCKQPVFDPHVDLARFIDQHYRIIEHIDDYLVLERKG